MGRMCAYKQATFHTHVSMIHFILLAILGFHSMMNQEQYHNSLLGKDQPKLGWNGIAKAYQPKALPFEPPNMTDVEKSIKQVQDDEYTLNNLNFNNIPVGLRWIVAV
jgi:hypothetical protein